MKKIIVLSVVMILGLCASVRGQGLKISTGHPDFKIKVTRCEAAGNTAFITLMLENVGEKAERIVVYGGATDSSFAIDDEGNNYSQTTFQVKMGSEPLSSVAVGATLYPDVPVKLNILIEGVPESITMFSKIILEVKCEAWGLDYKKKVQISNVPLSHDGD